jgi:hypothetical protein
LNEQLWSRRRFMITTAAAATVAVVTPSQAPGLERLRPHWVEFEDLKALEGERVRMVGASGRELNARVVDVADRTTTHRGITVEQYSVLLRTGLTRPVDDYTFDIQHPTFGNCRLFCSPVFNTARSIHYEATLSRLAD